MHDKYLMPKIYIIAGPNGSGKTTFAKEFLPNYAKCNNFVNADLIAAGLSPFSPVVAGMKAGRLLLAQIGELIDKKEDFAFETTFAGKAYLSLIKDARRKGYEIHVFFLWISDVRLAQERIRQRVKEGGHDVPMADVKRRFGRSRENFLKLYEPISDAWVLCDNSGGQPVEIALKTKGQIKIFNQEFYKSFLGG